jgi:hypothetical protein
MTVNLSALAGAGQQFFDNNGNPLSGGKLYSYAAGTTTPQATYTTAAGNITHTNPIILNSAGRVATGEIWLTAGQNYKFVLTTSTDVTIATWDNITGINGTGIATNANLVEYDPPFTGSVPTNVELKLAQTVSVKDFGAVGDGVTDDTAAFNNALTYLKSLAKGGKLFVPDPAVYYAVTSIDCTNFGFNTAKFIAIEGENNQSTRILGTQDDVAVFDCTGTSNMTMKDLWIGTKSGTYAQCGLLLARSTTETQANGNNFYDVWIQGDFKKAACISIGAESSRWFAPAFRNPYGSGTYKHCTFYTADQNGIGASSLYQTIYAGAAISPNTDNAMFKPHFFAVYTGGTDNVVFEGAAQWDMYSALVLGFDATNNRMATYISDATSNIFNGAVNWYSPLFECEDYIAHYLIGTAAVGVEASFRGIRQFGGYMNNWASPTYTLCQGKSGIGLPYNLTDCGFERLKHNIATTGALVYADVVTRGHYDDRYIKMMVTSTGYTDKVQFGNLAATSELGQTSFGVPFQNGGTVPPTTGYYPKNAVRWNENPTQGGFLGWVCTVAGSPGTWRGFGLVSRETGTGSAGYLIQTSIRSLALAASGTVDLALNTGGQGYQGTLIVGNSYSSTANQRTQTMFAVFGRGTDAVATSLATDNGSLGGASFTVTFPSSDTVRITNTSGAACDVYIQFIGGISA